MGGPPMVAVEALLLSAVVVASGLMGGCASTLEGTSQEISIATNPPGAECQMEREGDVIASFKTPGGTVVKKTKHDIDVTCTKVGYQDATGFLESGIESATFGNIILGGGIGWLIDSASGADNKYPTKITISMVPVGYTPTVSPEVGTTSPETVVTPLPPAIWQTVNSNVRAYALARGERRLRRHADVRAAETGRGTRRLGNVRVRSAKRGPKPRLDHDVGSPAAGIGFQSKTHAPLPTVSTAHRWSGVDVQDCNGPKWSARLAPAARPGRRLPQCGPPNVVEPAGVGIP